MIVKLYLTVVPGYGIRKVKYNMAFREWCIDRKLLIPLPVQEKKEKEETFTTIGIML